jgi:dihydrofolate reductase
MRKLIFAINSTIDGCVDHTKGSGNPEMLDHYTQLLAEADTFVYGRKTFQLMVPYWPDVIKDPAGSPESHIEYAKAFVAVENMVVFSKTLEKVDYKNTTIIRGNLAEEIMKLKKQPGKSLLTGGVDLASHLIALGLVDEYRVVIHPNIVGEGRQMMEGVPMTEKIPMQLVDTKVFKSGAIALRYQKQE